MIYQKKTLLSIAVGLVLAGCGGGTYSPPAVAGIAAGKVVDGYVSGALVVCDANSNGVADAGEKTSTTDGAGNFAFSPACTNAVFSIGGTSIDTGLPFKGIMKAPAGSKVITPLTSLMADSGLTAVQLAAALGLPVGTDVTQIDPVGTGNLDLQKKTVAIQLLLEQSAAALSVAAGDSSPATLNAIYSAMAKALGASLATATTPLISASGVVNTTVLNTVLSSAVTSLKTSTNSALAAAAANVSASTLATQFATQVQAVIAATTPAALTAATTAIAATVFASQTNVLSIINDSIVLNGDTFTLANFASTAGVTLAKKVSPLDTVSFGYTINGTAIPASANGVMTTSVKLGIELSDATRTLQFILDQADVSITNGVLAVSVPASAKLYAYGKTASGATANVTLINVNADQFITVSGNQLSFNAGNVLAKLAPSQTTFSGLQYITGTFNMKMAISNLNIVGATATSVQGFSVAVTGTSQSMNGLGVQGKFTIQ